jgi:membrane protease YdiL (CAAX protease family)
MPPTVDDSIVIVFGAGLLLAAAGAWIYLFVRWLKYGSVLPYAPRRAVPWGVWATALAALHVAARIAASPEGLADGPENGTSLALNLALGASLQLVFIALVVLAVALVTNATPEDLGLPISVSQAGRDVAIGVLACLAALPPVAAVRGLVMYLLGEPELHPLVQDVQQHPSALVFGLAFLSAVAVAPIYEEVVFRLLLQGWLEKGEDALLGWRDTTPLTSEAAPRDEEVSTEPSGGPPVEGATKMPHGALPILVSSVFFAWAHLGHSTDPFPLFVLALFLGFVYQRTHRILPCIVAHAMFNLISMFFFWRMIFPG